MTVRRVCAVTGSRADYGLLYHPMRAIVESQNLELLLAVTGMHLAPEHGMTVGRIKQDGFAISGRVEIPLASDSSVAIAKAIGVGVAGFADLYDRLQPDLVMVLGDRYEILAAGAAALVSRIPIAHLCGGDVTEGAYDEAIRHSLSKFSHLHFVTNEDARRRVIQLGERPTSVHTVGSPGLDFIRHFTPMSRRELAEELDITPASRWLVVTFHPPTLDRMAPMDQLDALLTALERFPGDNFTCIVTQPNADNDGLAMGERLRVWAAGRGYARLFTSLGQERYLSCLKHAAAVVGNSSSGLYEAPSFQVPTVNIGTRQRGRIRAASVVDCDPDPDQIYKAIEEALARDCSDIVNPYGDGRASERIVSVLEAVPDFRDLLQKRFHDLGSTQ